MLELAVFGLVDGHDRNAGVTTAGIGAVKSLFALRERAKFVGRPLRLSMTTVCGLEGCANLASPAWWIGHAVETTIDSAMFST